MHDSKLLGARNAKSLPLPLRFRGRADFAYFTAGITSTPPMYGTNTFGILTEPSAC